MLILSALTAPKESACCFTANGMKTSARLEPPSTITKRNCKKKLKKEETLAEAGQSIFFSELLACVGGGTLQIHSSGSCEIFGDAMYAHIHQFNGRCKFPH